MDAAEKAIERLTPEVEAVLAAGKNTGECWARTSAKVNAAVADLQTACREASLALNRLRRISRLSIVFHWGNIFYPSRWGQPFTTVEFIFEEN